MKKPFISRVVINNYKSIADCDVRLGALQFLVGRNGAGKSNFLDALAFVRDVLELNSLKKAMTPRMQGNAFHRNGKNIALNFGMDIKFNLPNGASGEFAFQIDYAEDDYRVTKESCRIETDDETHEYQTQDGKLQSDDPKSFPPVRSDRFYLQNMSAYDAFEPVCEAFEKMEVYNFIPQNILEADKTEPNTPLMSDGRNIAQVISELPDNVKDRVCEYLQLVAPAISNVEVINYDRHDEAVNGKYLMFHEKQGVFIRESMSYGTLRALCVITALLQRSQNGENNHPVLIGIEEPENGIHARAIRALLGAMREAKRMRQVIISTHSAEMLDSDDVASEQILPVEMSDSGTVIAPMDGDTKDMLRKHITTAGELLRQGQLQPQKPSIVSDSNQ